MSVHHAKHKMHLIEKVFVIENAYLLPSMNILGPTERSLFYILLVVVIRIMTGSHAELTRAKFSHNIVLC
jgi:hypothetical protein